MKRSIAGIMSAEQFAQVLEQVALDLRAYAAKLRQEGWDTDWEGGWSTYTLEAQGVVADLIVADHGTEG